MGQLLQDMTITTDEERSRVEGVYELLNDAEIEALKLKRVEGFDKADVNEVIRAIGKAKQSAMQALRNIERSRSAA